MLRHKKAQIIAFIFCCAFSAYSQTNPGTKDSAASINGKVTISGKAAAGITVGLRLEETSKAVRYRAVTDEQGNYKITNVPPGHYQVVAVAPGLVAADDLGRRRTILISKDETVENIDIPLVRGGVITGRVSDSEGRPAIEEEVSLHPVEVARGFFQISMTIRTDDRGIYRFYGLPAGKYRVGAGERDHISRGRSGGLYRLTFHPAAVDVSQASVIDVTEGSEATNVDITFGPPPVKYSAQGRILDGRTGQPLANVRYGVKYFVGEHGSSTTSGAFSNAAGEFKLENLSPGKYAVFIQTPPDVDWRAESIRFEVVNQDITGLIVKTIPGASVSGVVVLEGTDDKALHAELRKVRLHAHVADADLLSGDVNSSNIEQDGSFRVRALPAGTLVFALSEYRRFQIVRVERDGIVYPRGMRIKDGEQISGIRIVLNHGNGTIRGALKLEGGTLPPNAVMAVSVRRLGEDQQFAQPARVDARGEFLVEGLIPGTYEMVGAVYILGTRSAFRTTKQQVVVGAGAVTSVTLTVNMESTQDRP